MKSFCNWQLFCVLYSFSRLEKEKMAWLTDGYLRPLQVLLDSFRKKQASGLDSGLLKYWFFFIILSTPKIES